MSSESDDQLRSTKQLREMIGGGRWHLLTIEVDAPSKDKTNDANSSQTRNVLSGQFDTSLDPYCTASVLEQLAMCLVRAGFLVHSHDYG